MIESNYEVEIVKYGYRVLFTQAEHLVGVLDEDRVDYNVII